MAILFEIKHVTTYGYANPVRFGPHRAMFLPRPAARGRLLSWSAKTNLVSRTRWVSDGLSNTVTEIEIDEPGKELTFTFQIQGVHFGAKSVEQFALETRADKIPVQYTPDEWTDLLGFMRPHAEDPDVSVAAWSRSFVASAGDPTIDVLQRMLDAFRDGFRYQSRVSEGTLAPAETLRSKSGTCRDYAWLMIEGLRRLGFAARFVTGYMMRRSTELKPA
jgi:transglutaminase-like putative cysteine protease